MENYKNVFPFKLGTTSYILHKKNNNLLSNVTYLKDYFEVIQLLFFGKEYLDEVMSHNTLQQLHEIGQKSAVSYIIHLPLDLKLLDPRGRKVVESLNVTEKIIRETKFLDVYKYILHIDGCINLAYQTALNSRQTYFRFDSVLKDLAKRLENNTSKIAIENTDYDLTFYSDIIKKYGYSICMDIGHILRFNFDLEQFIKAFYNRIAVIHLHGCKNNKDHMSLKVIDTGMLTEIAQYVQNYNHALIIEVFNKRDLKDSLKRLADILKGGGHGAS